MDDVAFQSLTRAERDVLRASLGRTNDQIAAALHISPNTVATHMLAARRKLGSPPRGDAARAFHAWEAAHQDLPSRAEVMAPPVGSPDETGADHERVRETRTTFDHSDLPARPHQREPRDDRSPLLTNTILILLALTLILASIRYLPDLARRAQQVADILDPIPY